MLKEEYSFYLTDAQRWAIRDMGLSEVDVNFSTSGMVHATVFEDYEVRCFTFRKDGGIVKETRALDSDGWETICMDAEGVWTSELGEVVNG